MKDFTRDERIMMMLYNPGTRAGLVAELEAMRLQLTPSERRLGRLSKSRLLHPDGGRSRQTSDREPGAVDSLPYHCGPALQRCIL